VLLDGHDQELSLAQYSPSMWRLAHNIAEWKQAAAHAQAIDEAAERTACNSSRSRVASHPVQVQQGVLWLWGAGGSEEFVHSAAKSPAIAAEAEDPAWFAMCAPDLCSLRPPWGH